MKTNLPINTKFDIDSRTWTLEIDGKTAATIDVANNKVLIDHGCADGTLDSDTWLNLFHIMHGLVMAINDNESHELQSRIEDCIIDEQQDLIEFTMEEWL